jgi:hypothetical protein
MVAKVVPPPEKPWPVRGNTKAKMNRKNSGFMIALSTNPAPSRSCTRKSRSSSPYRLLA